VSSENVSSLGFLFPNNKWGHPIRGPCQEEKFILCGEIYFLANNSPQRTQRNEKIAGEKTINFYSGFEPNLCVLCLQPIMLRVLPVKVWLRQLTVWPDSYTRRSLGVTPGSESSKVKVLAGEERATRRAVA
jgi:hypothetical protein